MLREGERLALFFFNEINRARPQMHALMLCVMAGAALAGLLLLYLRTDLVRLRSGLALRRPHGRKDRSTQSSLPRSW